MRELAVYLLVSSTACGLLEETAKSDSSCSPKSALSSCLEAPDGYSCRWASLHSRRASAESIAALVGTESTLDAALRGLFPALEGKALVDDGPPELQVAVFDFSATDPYIVEFPIDWEVDPFSNNSWRLYFQQLQWLDGLYGRDELETGGAVVIDWVENAMGRDPPLEYSWHDMAIARRLDRVSHFAKIYIRERDPVDRRVVHAAAQLILTHLYALAADECYNDHNNHGLMQDYALLEHVKRYPNLGDGDALFELGLTRLQRHIDHSVTDDGSHTENSPAYHRDETGFEIYAFGQEVIVDAGKYSFDTDPLTRHQYSVFAHNVMVVDRVSYEPTGSPRIVAYDLGADTAWVQGAHDNYLELGIESQVRTFAHAKPAVFAVVDHISADHAHDYAQHFHLQPGRPAIAPTRTDYTEANGTMTISWSAGGVAHELTIPRAP